MGRRWAAACLWIGLLASLPSCKKGGKEPVAPPPAPVRVVEASTQDMPIDIGAIGTVVSKQDVDIKSQVAGPLSQVAVADGQRVAQGDLLFVIDPRPFEVALESAEAALARAKAQSAQARRDVARYEQLVQQQAIARQTYEQQQSQLRTLEAAVRQAEAAVDDARLNLGYTRITAPVTGRLGEIALHVGDLVKANADDPIVVIRQLQPIDVAFSVPATHLDEIRARRQRGEPMVVFASPPDPEGPPVEGTLTFVDNSVDPTSGTIRLKATFPNEDERLWPGSFVDVVLRLGFQKNAVVIPAQAVQPGQQGDTVWVVDGQNRAQERRVRVGTRQPDRVVVDEGVAAGEKVVTDGQLRLVPGAAVEILPNVPPGGPQAAPPGGPQAGQPGAAQPEGGPQHEPQQGGPQPGGPTPAGPQPGTGTGRETGTGVAP